MKKVLFIVVTLMFFYGCKKVEDDPYQQIQGKWYIQKVSYLAAEIPGDGSYLNFNGCVWGDYIGNDFNIINNSEGEFLYSFKDGNRVLSINDSSPLGGSYNEDWEIVYFTKNTLSIRGFNSMGSVVFELVKE